MIYYHNINNQHKSAVNRSGIYLKYEIGGTFAIKQIQVNAGFGLTKCCNFSIIGGSQAFWHI